MRGRKKTPTNLVLLRGNPGKRALNKEEPKPRPVLPEPPGHLDTGAKREWRRVAPELHQLGLLTVLDVDALPFTACAGRAGLRRRGSSTRKVLWSRGRRGRGPVRG
jgi:hypothetical protein